MTSEAEDIPHTDPREDRSACDEAADSATPAARLAELAEHEDCSVRFSVAWNPRASVATLTVLADDPDGEVRSAVANHAKCPLPVLERLAVDSDEGVRADVAANPRCAPDTLAWLATDPESGVRGEAAANPRTPLQSLLNLTEDTVEVLASLFRNRNFPDGLIEAYAFSDDPEARLLTASCGRVDAAVLHHLAYDPDARVRLAVAGNPHTPVEALEQLTTNPIVLDGELHGFPDRDLFADPAPDDWIAFTHNDAIQVAVAENPSTPIETLTGWLECGDDEDWDFHAAIRARISASGDLG